MAPVARLNGLVFSSTTPTSHRRRGRSQYFAHEALVRGPEGEGALSVLSQVTEQNRYRFDQACRVKAIKTAAQLGMRERLSINFLPNAVYRPEVCIKTTLEAARVHNFPIDHIIFEVTEGERVEDGPWLATILREYKRYGFLTAIDDFGAGFAGLTLLADFTPDFIKLDMALVRDVNVSRSRQAIARGMLRTCQELSIQVIAEGVETPAERDFFLYEGVTLMQGYLFAKPVFSGDHIGSHDVLAFTAASLTKPALHRSSAPNEASVYAGCLSTNSESRRKVAIRQDTWEAYKLGTFLDRGCIGIAPQCFGLSWATA